MNINFLKPLVINLIYLVTAFSSSACANLIDLSDIEGDFNNEYWNGLLCVFALSIMHFVRGVY